MLLEWFTIKNSTDLIGKLWGKLTRGRKKYAEELETMNTIMYQDPLEVARYYVEPECQDYNPADYESEIHLVTKRPIMEIINEFFKKEKSHPGDNQLFVLSDAGMGKTALLTMIKLAYLTDFWPKQTDCVLKKLGEKTLEELEGLTSRSQTVLLLDSLDEDSAAYGRVSERLQEILKTTKHFKKVLITCRTQYFPKGGDDAFKRPDLVDISGFSCPVKYLSFFDDHKVYAYLSKRFPKKFGLFRNNEKIEEAQKVIQKMGYLRCRPMILSYIDTLMKSPLIGEKESDYYIYDALVESWFKREQSKRDVSPEELMNASIILATVMNMRGVRSIREKDLDHLIEQIVQVKPIKKIDIKGRSLINRNSQGDWRFSHFSIQEFCVARLLLEDKFVFKPSKPIRMSNLMLQWMAELNKAPNFAELLDFKDAQIENIKIKNSVGMEFVAIPSGTFMMSSPKDEKGRFDDRETQHEVTLTKGFLMQTTPVTQAQWQAIMDDNPSHFKNYGDACPVENVSWDDVQQFIQRLNEREEQAIYRLPTEAEWEHACRAGSQTVYYYGNDAGQLSQYAWHDKNSDKHTHPAGQLKPNSWGLYDMHGNVFEWCSDWYDDYPSESVTDPQGPLIGRLRVMRGGSWYGYDTSRYCRSANRLFGPHDSRFRYVGLRLVRSLPFAL
ncbi:formylglycine-generating enzyme family protein [Desulfococcaceae bacterium HSG9]|nr:formylglycine-generating enzyme family protein [Desulfococcaceae bacterium HSG9]